MHFFIPQNYHNYTLEEDWTFDIGWDENLTFLKKYGITGDKEVKRTRWIDIKFPLRTEEPDFKIAYIQEEYMGKETALNKMFMDENGRMEKVRITLQAGTVLHLFKIRGRKNDFPHELGFKVVSCSDPKLLKVSFTVTSSELTGLSVKL